MEGVAYQWVILPSNQGLLDRRSVPWLVWNIGGWTVCNLPLAISGPRNGHWGNNSNIVWRLANSAFKYWVKLGLFAYSLGVVICSSGRLCITWRCAIEIMLNMQKLVVSHLAAAFTFAFISCQILGTVHLTRRFLG